MFSRKINFGGIFVKARRKKGLRCVTIMISGTFSFADKEFLKKWTCLLCSLSTHLLDKTHMCSWTIR